jgi:hypothetical protein
LIDAKLRPILVSLFCCTQIAAKMPPHGAGMSGATHSHNPEYPDDNWNLYSMIESTTVAALNVTRPTDAIGIFKPFVHRLSNEPELISDSDEEIIVRHR